MKETFSELFCIARDIDALVADHLVADNDDMHWDMNFIILVHDWLGDGLCIFSFQCFVFC